MTSPRPKVIRECDGCGQLYARGAWRGKTRFCSHPCAMAGIRSEMPERFWSHVSKTDACWIWTASHGGHGYGQFSFGGRPEPAHRVAWFLTHGTLPANGMFVCHRCDVRSCVRPDHLFLGTAADNNRDMQEKGRVRNQVLIHTLGKVGYVSAND